MAGLPFLGGAAGPALAGLLWVRGGWGAVCATGALAAAMLVFDGRRGASGSRVAAVRHDFIDSCVFISVLAKDAVLSTFGARK
ncbi:hypothetical protein [Bosea minatitlanensis]|uniref:MFS transporter n=1 Tax=Bosea minatitlanensis TaxID=128782 RepID=A0ABW0FBB1_9HYPH|nr:hypothetical protein [Bosea minatitlanensis]MCT4495667.1 hypothetical protein [Bosea minatitlanensis]